MNRTLEKSGDPDIFKKVKEHREAVDRYHARVFGFENQTAANKNAEDSGIDIRKVLGAKVIFNKNPLASTMFGHHRGADLGTGNASFLRRSQSKRIRKTGSNRGS